MNKNQYWEFMADLILELDADMQQAARNNRVQRRVTKKSSGEVTKIPRVLRALTDEQAIFCRKYHKHYGAVKLAMKFEVSPKTVMRAVMGITHKHLNKKVPPANQL
jgi:hypothetical protein